MEQGTTNEEKKQTVCKAENEKVEEVEKSGIQSSESKVNGEGAEVEGEPQADDVDTCEEEPELGEQKLVIEPPSAEDIKQIVHEAVYEFWSETLEPNLRSLLDEPSKQPTADVEQIEQIVRESTTELGQTLKPDFERVLGVPDKVDRALNGVFSKIFDRIEDPQGRFAFNLQRNLLKGLLSIYDLLQDLEGNTERELSDKEHRANYGTIRTQMLQLFVFNDIKPIIPEVSIKMDALYHRAVEVEATREQEEDNCIERCIRDGFIYGSIVLRPAEVTVKKYSPEAELPDEPTDEES